VSVACPVGSREAASVSASRKGPGNTLPRFAARRSMPAQAFALKKYRCGRSPVSRISDNEDTPSSLRDSPSKPVHSHVLSVQRSVRPPIPEFFQAPEECPKIPSSVRRQDSGHILPHHPSGAYALSQSKKFEGQVRTVVSQAAAQSGDRESLARGSSHENVDCWCVDACEVAKVRNSRKAMSEDSRRERRDLGRELALPAEP